MKILADALLPGLTQAFPKPFELSFYHESHEVPYLLKEQQILLCRSTLKVNEALLKGHSLKYIATASSGTDHIDSIYLKRHGIELIDAKGSNAIAVADYVVATLAFLEKYKRFSGSKACVVGVGKVGTKVVERLIAAGMQVYCYDPPRAASQVNFYSSPLEILTQCDLISIHANLHDTPPYPSQNLFDEKLFSQLKTNVVIINASRGGIINESALLQHKKPLIYCTDVYSNEPNINPRIVALATLCTPHIAGHSIEAKYKAVAMVSQKLHACLHLVPPHLSEVLVTKKISASKSWQNIVLTLYNPMNETNLLKSAENLRVTFQNVRKSHQQRHDFCKYSLPFIEEHAILGF